MTGKRAGALLTKALRATSSATTKRPRKRIAKVTYGPVTTIDTAPVAIGNSYQGAAPVVVPIEDGMRVKGRDYMLKLDSTIQMYVNGWTLVGGIPITPACMIASAVKGFNNTYSEYMVHAVAFHFITSCSTSHDGSVMMYIGKNRKLPLPNTSNPNFMSFVLSDHNTCISPVWKNSTSVYVPPLIWRTTSPLDCESLEEQSAGEVFLYTKFNTLSETIPASPGYVIMDYDISFREMALNVRNLTFPCSRMKYNQVALSLLNPVVNTVVEMSMDVQTFMDGSFSYSPVGTLVGDVFKVTMNTDNHGGITNPVLWFHVNLPVAGGAAVQAVPISDGYTCYGVVNNLNKLVLFPTYPGSTSEANPLLWNGVVAADYRVIAYISLVGSAFNSNLQSNF
jgi:hypothetical protein